MTLENNNQNIYRNTLSENILNRPNLESLNNWYQEQLKNFGEIIIETAPLTDGNKWKGELTDNGEISTIDGAFFTLQGQSISRYKPDGTFVQNWTQPGLIQKEGIVTLPTKDGPKEVRISGFIGIIINEAGKVLLTLTQEPFAHTPKKVLCRTPFQTSAAKLQSILAGDRTKDPQLFDLISSISPDKKMEEIFQSGILDIFPLPYADANRIDATNLGFLLQITDPELTNKLENNGGNRWCSGEEIRALVRAGILNGHTSSAILAIL